MFFHKVQEIMNLSTASLYGNLHMYATGLLCLSCMQLHSVVVMPCITSCGKVRIKEEMI